jgi:hypothetical protein
MLASLRNVLVPVSLLVMLSSCSLIYPFSNLEGGEKPDAATRGHDASDGGTDGSDGALGGSSRCDASSFLFCDGFEEDNLNEWTIQTSQGAATEIVTTRAARGTHSLASTLPATSDAIHAYVVHVQDDLPLPLYARIFVFLPSSPGSAGVNLFAMNDAAGGGVVVFANGGATPTVAASTYNVPGASTKLTNVEIPTEKWVCFELAVSRDAPLQLSMNGEKVDGISQGLDVSSLNTLTLGLGYSATEGTLPAYSAWFDEVVLNGSPIGCDE